MREGPAYLLLSPPHGTTNPLHPTNSPPPPPPSSPASAVIKNDDAGTDADDDNVNDDRGELDEAKGFGICPFPPLLILESELQTFPLQLPLPLIYPPSFAPSSPLLPMFLLSSLSLLSYLRPLPPPPPYLPLRSPRSLQQSNLNPNHDLDQYLNIIVNAPEASVPLDLFLSLLWGYIDLDLDLFLAPQEDTPILLPL